MSATKNPFNNGGYIGVSPEYQTDPEILALNPEGEDEDELDLEYTAGVTPDDDSDDSSEDSNDTSGETKDEEAPKQTPPTPETPKKLAPPKPAASKTK